MYFAVPPSPPILPQAEQPVDSVIQQWIDSLEPAILAYHGWLHASRKVDSSSAYAPATSASRPTGAPVNSIPVEPVPGGAGRNRLEALCNSSKEPPLIRFRFHQNRYAVCMVNADNFQLRIHANTTGQVQPLSSIWTGLVRRGARPYMVMNGGMYEQDGSPVGLLVTDKVMRKRLDRTAARIPDNFHLYPNGVFWADAHGKLHVMTSAAFTRKGKGQLLFATQSGPMLLWDGNIHPSFIFGSANLNIRNGVGVVGGKRNYAAFLISETKVNFFEMALVFKYILNCPDALYLDGSISRMYYNKGTYSFGGLDGELGPVISVCAK